MFKSVNAMTGVGMEKKYISQGGLKFSNNVLEWMTMIVGGRG